MKVFGIEWYELDRPLNMTVLSEAPAVPPDTRIKFYCRNSPAKLYYLRSDGTEIELAGVGGVAPLDAEYIVAASNATLTAERVATNTTSILWDFATGAQAKAVRAALTGDVTAAQDSNATTIANNAVSNAKLADMAAWTFKVRNAATSGDPSDAALADVTTATPASGDFVVGFKSTGEIRKFDASGLGSSGGHILLSDTRSTPFSFNDMLQMDLGEDFMWTDPED